MGASKTHIFNSSQNGLASMAKVLAHPARIAILQHISKNGNCMCDELVDVIGLSQPTITQHLNEIKKAHLLKSFFKGKYLQYSLKEEEWRDLQGQFLIFFDCIDKSILKGMPHED